MNKSWHLDRRTFLMGTGVSLGLPWMECMGGRDNGSPDDQAKRFCAMYFGFGVGLPSEESDQAKWRWFPKGEGKDFEFTEVLDPLETHRNHVTVLGGLSHPNGRRMGGHDTADTFLTASYLNNKFLKNTVSIDQLAARALDDQTRFSSLVLSTDGGVGEPTRSSTLSYDEKGRPIPALHQPQQIFDRFFGDGDADSITNRRRMRSASGMLDRTLEDSRSLRRRLGSQDREKFDEYLESVRQIEERVQRSQRWLEIPRPELRDEDREMLTLGADDEAPKDFIRTMYDLIYLAFRTDSTRRYLPNHEHGGLLFQGCEVSSAGRIQEVAPLVSARLEQTRRRRGARQVGPVHGTATRLFPRTAGWCSRRKRIGIGQFARFVRQQQ